MARRATQKPAIDVTATVDEAAITAATAEHDAHNKNMALIDEKYGDSLPYDMPRIINETRFYLQQSADAMLEAGKRLILLREHEPHGEFTRALDTIGIHPRTARRFIQAATKFSANSAALSHLGKTKLLELMTEDDDDIQALADGGTLAGHTLDEIDQMTTRELKIALRESRQTITQARETTDALLAKKDEKINALDKSLHQRDSATLDETVVRLSSELETQTIKSIGALLGPQAVIHEVLELPHAPQYLRDACAQALNRIRTALDEAQNRLGVDDLSSQPGEDDWMSQVDASETVVN